MGYYGHVVVSRIRALRTDIYMLDVCFYLIKSCHPNRYQCFGECLYLAWIARVHEITGALVSQQTIFIGRIAPTWERYTGCINEANCLVRPCMRARMGQEVVVWGHWQAGYPVQLCGEIERMAGMVKRVLVLVLLMAKNVMAEQGATIMTASRNILIMMVTTTTVIMLMI